MNKIGVILGGKRGRQTILKLCDKVQGAMAAKGRGIRIRLGGAGRLGGWRKGVWMLRLEG